MGHSKGVVGGCVAEGALSCPRRWVRGLNGHQTCGGGALPLRSAATTHTVWMCTATAPHTRTLSPPSALPRKRLTDAEGKLKAALSDRQAAVAEKATLEKQVGGVAAKGEGVRGREGYPAGEAGGWGGSRVIWSA